MKHLTVAAIAAMLTLIAASVPGADPSVVNKEPAEIRAKQTKEDRIAAMAPGPTGGAAKIGRPDGIPHRDLDLDRVFFDAGSVLRRVPAGVGRYRVEHRRRRQVGLPDARE